jgi:CRISPR-associated protein Cmr2
MADYFNKNLAILLNPRLSQELIDKNEKEMSGEEAEAVTAINNAFTDYLVRQGLPAGEDQGFRGRLYFYPTFFDNIDLEVINPHDRETGAGKLPIYIESVPAGARGNFSLVYSPWDLMGCRDREGLAAKVEGDLYLVAEALEDLMLNYGFSAKKSSGFGIIEDAITGGTLSLKGLKKSGVMEKYEFSNLAALSTHLKKLGVNHGDDR